MLEKIVQNKIAKASDCKICRNMSDPWRLTSKQYPISHFHIFLASREFTYKFTPSNISTNMINRCWDQIYLFCLMQYLYKANSKEAPSRRMKQTYRQYWPQQCLPSHSGVLAQSPEQIPQTIKVYFRNLGGFCLNFSVLVFVLGLRI